MPSESHKENLRSGTSIIISALAAVVLLAVTVYYTGPAVEVRQLRIDRTLSGQPLRYVLFLPSDHASLPPRSRPAVVAIPPYSIQPEAMEIICIEVARRGGACAIPDFFGKSRAESRHRMGEDALIILTGDVLSIITELRRLPFVNPDKVGACGHSVGGTVTALVGMEDRRLRAAVPIGMYFSEYSRYPQNLLFLSGLYDEIHPPVGLLDILTDVGVPVPDPATSGSVPANGQTYGDFKNGSARQTTIIPTTDHFIETFDPWLIHNLLAWYAKAFDYPTLDAGPLREWRRRVAALLFIFAAGAFYVLAGSRIGTKITGRLAPHYPEWIIARLQSAPLLVILITLFVGARASASQRTLFVDLMIILTLAHELVSHRVRGTLAHGPRSPYRIFRSAALIGAALGIGTLVSFGLACLSEFYVFPEFAKWYPVFALNMAVLFPLEVWGRSRPFLFEGLPGSVHPTAAFYVLAAFAIIMPGIVARGLETLARELVLTVRARLKPAPAAVAVQPDDTHPGAKATPVKIALAVILMIVLILIAHRRIAEGMLTWETGKYAAISILRFAILPFVAAALIIRTKAFRKIALLD